MKEVKCAACAGEGRFETKIFGVTILAQCATCKGYGKVFYLDNDSDKDRRDDDDDDNWMRDRIQSVFD